MSKLEVIVQRDSVCAGDDMSAPNEERFYLNAEAKLEEVFSRLSSMGYLPSIAGVNERWEAQVNGVVVCKFGKNIENPEYLLPKTSQVCSIGTFNGSAHVWLKYFSAKD